MQSTTATGVLQDSDSDDLGVVSHPPTPAPERLGHTETIDTFSEATRGGTASLSRSHLTPTPRPSRLLDLPLLTTETTKVPTFSEARRVLVGDWLAGNMQTTKMIANNQELLQITIHYEAARSALFGIHALLSHTLI
ncbi:hypothetical protein THAOC_08408 [Thalassiosira oceanica]|uniref:Uncharacterized protein n=1 Tax=Thalassiosira oceanica TaxID=159749 RepID=K0TA46_THAOC|nr:hypothetical protein THAOC_08408 [Thalassiosira oceanica]|eukprot:EJK70246.1 hypothetical protein THAOC_08408 [Thalassiosira oceanica]